MDGLHAFDPDVGNHLTDETIMQATVWRISKFSSSNHTGAHMVLPSEAQVLSIMLKSPTPNEVRRVLAETQSIQTIQSKNFTIHVFS